MDSGSVISSNSYEEKCRKKEKLRVMLEYDRNVKGIPVDRKPYERKTFEEPDTGLKIGNFKSKEDLRIERISKQQEYRKLLEDAKNAEPIPTTRKAYHRKELDGNRNKSKSFDDDEMKKRDLKIQKYKQIQQNNFEKMTKDGLLLHKPNELTTYSSAKLNNKNIDDNVDSMIERVNSKFNVNSPEKKSPFLYGAEPEVEVLTSNYVAPTEFFIPSEEVHGKYRKSNIKQNQLLYREQLERDIKRKKDQKLVDEMYANTRDLECYA
eukprot:TRINITY_DN58669_c0_g1_i1.p1 TRINITY_DN58669_c0_g1~~TRINITY_DN58669_c0_g1_i1.p1  ORF type:complete len:265 (-),score=13.43 TRINITY_DN58669_c0_g1_i1:51-845(-)